MYQSKPKDLSLYKDDAEDTESVASTDSDTTVEVDTKNTKNTTKPRKEGFTGKEDKKNKKDKKKKPNPIVQFFSAPDVSGQTVNQRIATGFRVFGYRMFIVILMIFLGINFRFAANKFGNEDYFPTDTTLPPYYPTQEELKYLEPTKDLKGVCKTDDTAEYIGRFRRPDETYPEFLYYDGMKLPNKDPCITEGATSDGWYIRLSIQISKFFGVIGDIFNSLINTITSLFTRAVTGSEDLVETAVIEPELNIARQTEKLASDLEKAKAEAQAQAYIEKRKADASLQQQIPSRSVIQPQQIQQVYSPAQPEQVQAIAQSNKTSMPTQPTQPTQPVQPSRPSKGIKMRSPKRGLKIKPSAQQRVANLNRAPISQTGGASQTHRFSKFLNPYAFDRERKVTDLTYFYRPIWAKSTQVSSTFTNMILQKLLSFFKGDTEIKESHGTLKQMLNILLFILMSFLLIVAIVFSLPFATVYSFVLSFISIILAGGGVPMISVILLGISIIGIPLAIYMAIFIGFNQVVNSGIIIWRILYFLIHIVLGPFISLNQGKEEVKELFDIIRKDVNGFFAISWLMFVFTAYQVAPDKYNKGVLIGGILAPILFGFAMNSDSKDVADTLMFLNVMGFMGGDDE